MGIEAANIMLDKIIIFISGKVKTSTCNWLDRLTTTAFAILASKKAKTAKYVFDKTLLLLAHL